MSNNLIELLEKLTGNMELNLGGLRDQLRAELAALKEAQGEAVAWRYTSSQSFGRSDRKWHYQESFPHAGNRAVLEIGALDALYLSPPASSDAVSVPVAMPERWEDRLSRMHQTIQAGCWPKRWVDDAKDYELGELRALIARRGVKS